MAVGEGRGQSTVVGFVLLLGILTLAITVHQTTVVPDQNAAVELRHHESVVRDFQSLRRGVFDAGRHGGTSPVAVDLGTRYPPRLIALNPPPASGSLHTTAGGEIRVRVDGQRFDLSALCGYGSDPVTTRSLVYDPSYNALPAMPSVVYGNTVVAQVNEDGVVETETGQALVDNRTVTFAPLAGRVEQSGIETASISLKGGPANSTQVAADSAVRLSIPSRLPASTWRDLLADEPAVTQVTEGGPNRIAVTLGAGNYSLACYAVGLDDAPPSGMAAVGMPDVTDGGTGGTGGSGSTGNETPTQPTEASIANLTITDKSTRRIAKFDLGYRIEDFGDGRVEITFAHPTRRSATETYTRQSAEGTVKYRGGLFSAQNESGEPATYTITVEVYDADGTLVDSVSFEERADGDGGPKDVV